uniref:Uncharacterized protein n=1 Tax=Leersia perrieri TaxID=77586 RepID=A0A0D9WXF3_9ORYZ
MWTLPEANEIAQPNANLEEGSTPVATEYDKTIASLETELSAARSLQESLLNGSPVAEEF